MSYYTSVPIVLYTIYIKFLHENYYLIIRRALTLIKNIYNHSAVFDVRLDTVIKAPKDNGVYCECNMFVQREISHANQFSTSGATGICFVNTFALSQLLAFCGSSHAITQKEEHVN